MLGLLPLMAALGCNGPRDRLARFDHLYTQGDWNGAWTCVQEVPEPGNPPKGNDLLWALQRATVQRELQDYQTSNQWFDKAEDMMKYYDLGSKALDGVGSTLVNENTIPYRGSTYDGIMVNTYKALNYMALGQDDAARVEFNRAVERQRRARERFNAEIQREKAENDEKKTNKSVDYDKTLNNDATEEKIRAKYASLYEFEAYPDFVNPFATYIAGIFFTMIDDPDKAIDLLKESAGMVGSSQTIMEDFAGVDQWLSEGKPIPPCVWVIYENGVGPIKEEFRVDLPLYMVSKDVLYAGIALPKLTPRSLATRDLTVKSGETWVRTEEVADMDRVIQTEFAKVFPGILARALISAAAKVVMQDTLTDRGGMGGQLMGLAAAIYSQVTTAADCRIWTSLPKDFQVARVPMPKDPQLQIRLDGGEPREVSIPACRYALVYVKKVAAGADPVIEVMTRGTGVIKK